MSRAAGLFWDNLIRRSTAALAASSAEGALPCSRVASPQRSSPWRSDLGWNVGPHNDCIPLTEDAAAHQGFIAHGNYATGALYAAAVQAALAASAYGPDANTNLATWFRADKGVTRDADGNVTGWEDQSGNGHHLDTVRGTPDFIEGIINGRPAIYFDGLESLADSGDYFDAISATDGECTALFVMKLDGTPTQEGYLWAADSSFSDKSRQSVTTGGDLKSYSRNGGAGVVSVTTAIPADQWVVALWEKDTNTFLYVAVDDLDSAALTSTALTGTDSWQGGNLVIGGRNHATLGGFKGWIAEVIFIADDVSEAWRQHWAAYILAKYGISTDTTTAGPSNGYAVSHADSKFTIARSSGADAVAFTFASSSHAEACAALDIGFPETDVTGATSYTSDSPVEHSREYLSFDMRGELEFVETPIASGLNASLDFDEGAGELTATIANGTYSTGDDLAAALTTAMNAVAVTNTYLVTYGALTKTFTIARATGAATLSLLWSSGTNAATSVGTVLGFIVSADDTSATTYESDYPATRINVRSGIVLDHNAGLGGTFTLQWSNQSEWQALTDPDGSVALTGDDALRFAYWSTLRQFPFWVLMIEDQHNPDGYSEIGAVFVGDYEDGIANTRSLSEKWEDLSEVEMTGNGGSFQNQRAVPRDWGSLEFLLVANPEKDELDLMLRGLGVGGHLFVCLDLAQPTRWMRYGTLKSQASYRWRSSPTSTTDYWHLKLPFAEVTE